MNHNTKFDSMPLPDQEAEEEKQVDAAAPNFVESKVEGFSVPCMLYI